jgi:3',5'-cyclic AMP phosphodiesterase CpdA
MRLLWLTDIHLNFVPPPQVLSFLDQVVAAGPDAVALTGDVAEAHDLSLHLRRMAERINRPIYFVLGNHDFYFGSIRGVRQEVERLCTAHPLLRWLPRAGVVELTPTTALVGHDGWADARLGDYERSYVVMNDYRLVEELVVAGKQDRWPLLKQLGDEAAAHLQSVLPDALQRYPQVFVLTHVPPFREACWYQGQISDDHWLPHFTCQAMGQVLLECAARRPDRQITVLCGHTHSGGETRPLANLLVLTGGAMYASPEIQRVFSLA